MALEGKLVRLREQREADVELFLALRNDMATQGWNKSLPPDFTLGMLRGRLAGREFSFDRTDGHFVIERRDTGAAIGTISYSGLNPRWDASYGIALSREAWGAGLAHDAQETLLRFLFLDLGLQVVRLWTHAANPRMVRLAERSGFQISLRQRESCYKDGVLCDTLMMDLLRAEYLAQHDLGDALPPLDGARAATYDGPAAGRPTPGGEMPMSENRARLEALAGQPAAVEWFRGLFAEAHVELADTGERFTIVHQGDRAEVLEGFQRPDANLVVSLRSTNLERLTSIFADGTVGPSEEYRIVRFMLRPCLEAALRMPILNHDVLRKILRMDDAWQQALLDPEGREDLRLTIEKANGHWTVTEGFHGHPRRRLALTAPQLLEFQRRVFAADRQDSMSGWLDLANWYVGWRDRVTVPATSSP
jgi:RimJ/RimL family protein N-acetyltransferase